MVFNMFRRKPELPENDALLKAIIKLSTQQTSENYRAFYQEILKSNLVLAEENGESRPILLTDEQERITLPVFTDVERVKKVYPDAIRVGKLPAQQILHIAHENNYHKININPEYGPGGFLDAEEISLLATGTIPDTPSQDHNDLGDGTFVPLGDPKLPSQEKLDEVVDKAGQLLVHEANVKMGFLILMRSETGKSQLTIALRAVQGTDLDKMSDFSQNFVNIIEAVLEQPLRLMWMDDQIYSSVSINSQPFYVKK